MTDRLKLAAELRDLGSSKVSALPREFYLPENLRGTKPNVDSQGTDLAIWAWEQNGRPTAVAFQGRANKPLWDHYFRSEGQRREKIEKTIELRKHILEQKEKKREEKRNWNSGAQVGDILYSSWGYDQTNIDFYQVTGVGKKQIVIREIGKRVVKEDEISERVIAAPNKFVGRAQKKMPKPAGRDGYSVKLNSFSNAYIWDGKPKYQTGPYGGH